MSGQQMIYNLPENLSVRELREWFSDSRDVQEDPAADVERVYFDTFDWRLFRSGSALEISTEHPGYLLTWRKLDSGRTLIQIPVRKIPHNADEILAPGLRGQLKEVLGARALMPQISVQSKAQSLRLLDSDDKTVMRVELRQEQVVIPQSTKHYKLPATVHLIPYRGYMDVFRRKSGQLTQRGRLRAVREDPLVTALDCLGKQAGTYSNKPDLVLDPRQPAHQALKMVLEKFRSIMEKNIAGASEDRDPEFLHDFLHATRRTQCLLQHYFPVFSSRRMGIFRQDFEWIDKVTSPVRSLDIYLGLFDEFVTRVDLDHRKALGPLRSFLQAQKQKEHKAMRTPLESRRFHKLMESWKNFLNEASPAAELSPEARQPIIDIASSGILSIYNELLEKGRRLGSVKSGQLPDNLLELQVICKKLGYEMETFQSLYPAGDIERAMSALQCLQANLNACNNLHLQHGSLLDYSKKMQQEQRTMPVWLEAIDLLAADREKEELKMQEEFQACFEKLSRKKMKRHFRSLFSQKKRSNNKRR